MNNSVNVSCQFNFKQGKKSKMTEEEKKYKLIKEGFCSCGLEILRTKHLFGTWQETGNKCILCQGKENQVEELNVEELKVEVEESKVEVEVEELNPNYVVSTMKELPVQGVMKPILTDKQNNLIIQTIKDNDSKINSNNLDLDDFQKSFIQYIYSLNSRVLNSEKLLEEKNEELDSINKYLEKEEEVLESNIQEVKLKIEKHFALGDKRPSVYPIRHLRNFLTQIRDKKKERHDKSYGIIAIEQGIINHNKLSELYWNSSVKERKKESELLESYIKWEALEVLPSMSWADYFLRIKKVAEERSDTSYAIEAFKNIQSIMECYVKDFKLNKIYEKESDEFEDKEEALVLELKDEKEAHNNTKKLLEDEKKAHQTTKKLLEEKEEAHKLELKKMSDEIKNMKKQFNIYKTSLVKSIEDMKIQFADELPPNCLLE